VDYSFAPDGAGSVTVVLREEMPLLADALKDCLSTDSPAGAVHDGPSTYWLDEALHQIGLRLEFGGDEPVASGNLTSLTVVDGRVEARWDVHPVDGDKVDAVAVEDFVAFLREWRARVLAESPGAALQRPRPRAAIPLPPAP